MKHVSVILVGAEHPGNVGAVARAMHNFGFEKLVLIAPQCDHLCEEARNRAKWAQEILENVVIGDLKLLDDFDLLIATSARTGTDYNLPRTPLLPDELVLQSSGKIGILFGRESSGLTNDEIAKADYLVTIPTAKNKSLNVSHAVAVILYELSKSEHATAVKQKYPLANARQKEELRKLIDDVLAQMTFATPHKAKTQKLLWQRLVGTAHLTGREAQALLGFFKKIKSG